MDEVVAVRTGIDGKKAINKLPTSGDNMSSTIECREKVITKIGMLSESKLKSALDFVEYLTEKEEWEATQEILSDVTAVKNIREADAAWKDKREEEFISWEAVRKDV